MENDPLLGFEQEERDSFQHIAPFLTPNTRKAKRVANSYRFFRTICTGIDEAERRRLESMVTKKDIAMCGRMSRAEIWCGTVLKLFCMAEQWPYRTALLFQLAEHVCFKRAFNKAFKKAFALGDDADTVPTASMLLHDVFTARPECLLGVCTGAADAHAEPTLAGVDMDETYMLDFLSEVPSPSLEDLHLLGPYLFSLSNAVRQASESDLSLLATDDTERCAARDWCGNRTDTQGTTHGMQFLDVWAYRLRGLTPGSTPGGHGDVAKSAAGAEESVDADEDDLGSYLRGLGLVDAAGVGASLEGLGVGTRAGWLSVARDEEDLAEAMEALKAAAVALGDRNKLKQARLT